MAKGMGMAELSGSVPTTLGALVGAATFAAGFLSTRVHRQREHAMGVAQQMDDRMDEAALKGEPIDSHLTRNQLRALDEASTDGLDVVALGSVVTLTGAVLALGLVVARSVDLSWASQDGWLILAFMAGAAVILAASVIDLVSTRREVGRRRSGTVFGLLERADTLLRKPNRSRDAVAVAEEAVRRSRGLYGPAWRVLANAQLAALAGPLPDADAWLRARAYLDRAAALGPESTALSWARGYAAERGPAPDVEEATREYVRGCWLHHEATRPLARHDEVIDPPYLRDERALVGTAGDSQAILDDPTTLRFRPTLTATLSAALGRIPALYTEAGMTAELLRASTTFSEANSALAVEATVEWLERMGELVGAGVMKARAERLLDGPSAPEWKAGVVDYLKEVRAGEEREERAEAERAREAEETARRLDQIVDSLGSNADSIRASADARDHDPGEIDWAQEAAQFDAGTAARPSDIDAWLAEQEVEHEEARVLTADMDERIASIERRSAGRATELDLESLQDLAEAHPESPWPEPRPRPGEQVDEGRRHVDPDG